MSHPDNFTDDSPKDPGMLVFGGSLFGGQGEGHMHGGYANSTVHFLKLSHPDKSNDGLSVDSTGNGLFTGTPEGAWGANGPGEMRGSDGGRVGRGGGESDMLAVVPITVHRCVCAGFRV